MIRGIAIIIFSFGVLIWSNVGLAQGAIYKWVDSKGTVHYSNTPTREARSIDDELPPATSFGTQSDSASHTETNLSSLPAHRATSDAADDATDVEETFNQFDQFDQNEEEVEVRDVGIDEDFALGQDGPFGTDNSNEFED